MGDLSLCSGDDILPPMSSSLLVELLVVVILLVISVGAIVVTEVTAVGVECAALTNAVAAGSTISGVLGNKALRPWRRIDVEPVDPELPELGARFCVLGENLDSSERCLRSHQFCGKELNWNEKECYFINITIQTFSS